MFNGYSQYEEHIRYDLQRLSRHSRRSEGSNSALPVARQQTAGSDSLGDRIRYH